VQALRHFPGKRGKFCHVVAVAGIHIVKQRQLTGGLRQQGQTHLAQIRTLLFVVAALRQTCGNMVSGAEVTLPRGNDTPVHAAAFTYIRVRAAFDDHFDQMSPNNLLNAGYALLFYHSINKKSTGKGI